MRANQAHNLDALDLKILRVLQVDASLSLEDLSERVGLSHTPCWRRIKKMEEQKIIRARVALIDQDAIQLGITVLTIVKLSGHSEEMMKQFENEASRCPEIVECYSIFGNNDYLLKIVASDVSEYENILKRRLLHLPYVESAKSMIALKRVKSTTALPI